MQVAGSGNLDLVGERKLKVEDAKVKENFQVVFFILNFFSLR